MLLHQKDLQFKQMELSLGGATKISPSHLPDCTQEYFNLSATSRFDSAQHKYLL